MIEQQSFAFKVVITGQSAVGKSSILKRYCDDVFEENYLPTIGVDFRFKRVEIGGCVCKFQIWDTAGQEKFKSITRTYYNNADIVLIVYDVTNPESFASIQNHWVEQAKENITKQCIICIVGNKGDLPSRTNRDIVQIYASDMNFREYQVSAKNGQGLLQLFEQLGQSLINKRKNAEIVIKKIFRSKKIESKRLSLGIA